MWIIACEDVSHPVDRDLVLLETGQAYPVHTFLHHCETVGVDNVACILCLDYETVERVQADCRNG